MTLVNIDLRNQGYETGPDDRVIFYSLLVREGDFGTISTAPVEVELTDGKASVDLAPGPVGVQIIAGQIADTRIKIGEVPPSGPTTLNAVMMVTPAYTPALQAQFIKAIQAEQAKAVSSLGLALDGELSQYRDYASEAIMVAGNVNDRVAALEKRESLEPGAVTDGQTANLIAQPNSLTRGAISNAYATISSEEYVPKVVYFGSDRNFPRPDTTRPVIWVGQALPRMRAEGDIVMQGAQEWWPSSLDLLAWYPPPLPGADVYPIQDAGPNAIDLDRTFGTVTVSEDDLGSPAYRFGTAAVSSPIYDAGIWSGTVTVYMVCLVDSGASIESTLFDSTTADHKLTITHVATTNRLKVTGATASSSPNGAFPADQPVIISVTFPNGAGTVGKVNGQTVIGPLDIGQQTGDVTRHRIGANFGGGFALAGAVGETIIAKEVTPEQDSQVMAYLSERWQIAL